MAVSYKDLGLVNTREMFKRAIKGGYAIPAFNFNNLEQLQAIITASSELKSPVMQTQLSFVIWLKVPLRMQKNWVVHIPKSCSIWIMAIALSCAKTV